MSRLLRNLDEWYLKVPFSSRKMAVQLGVGPPPRLAVDAHPGHRSPLSETELARFTPGQQVYPYLLRGVAIERPNHVWSTDITYLPMRGGFLSGGGDDQLRRFVLSWELSNTMETVSLAALNAAFFVSASPKSGTRIRARSSPRPTSWRCSSSAESDWHDAGRALTMFLSNGYGARSSIEPRFIPRLRYRPRTVPSALENYFHFYNHQRPHQALGYSNAASRPVSKPKRKRSLLKDGDAVPQTPWDLSLSFSRMDVSFLYCKTAPAAQSKCLIGI